MTVHGMICIGLDVQCSKICSNIMQGMILDVDLATGTLEHSSRCHLCIWTFVYLAVSAVDKPSLKMVKCQVADTF